MTTYELDYRAGRGEAPTTLGPLTAKHKAEVLKQNDLKGKPDDFDFRVVSDRIGRSATVEVTPKAKAEPAPDKKEAPKK
jgi:hypothetical protein